MNKKRIYGVLIFVVVFATLLFCSSFSVATKSEYSVIKRFGKIEKVVSKPGPVFKIPVIEKVSKVTKKLLIYDIPATEVITKDKKNMVVDCYVTWQITDPIIFAQSLNSSITSAEARINSNVFNAVKNTISSIDQKDLINIRDKELSETILKSIPSTESKYGIKISSVEIKMLDLPTDNKTAVYERMRSEREEIAAGYAAKGDAEKKKMENNTDKTVALNISNAKTEAEKIIAEGEKEYMRILNEAYANSDKKEFYNFMLELDAIEKYMVGDKTIILPKDSPLVTLFTEGY